MSAIAAPDGLLAPTTALAVANAFLDIQERDSGAFPRIDQMKLQKLVFYAHAWHLATRDGPLFDEDVHAWPWGPVVPAVYSEFCNFGRRPIVGARAKELVFDQDKIFSATIREPVPPSDEITAFLRDVWASHKAFTGVQLSNATHGSGEPWTIVKEGYGGDLSRKPPIPNTLIRDTFKAKLKKP